MTSLLLIFSIFMMSLSLFSIFMMSLLLFQYVRCHCYFLNTCDVTVTFFNINDVMPFASSIFRSLPICLDEYFKIAWISFFDENKENSNSGNALMAEIIVFQMMGSSMNEINAWRWKGSMILWRQYVRLCTQNSRREDQRELKNIENSVTSFMDNL